MLRSNAAAKKKNDEIDARKIADLLRCDLLPEYHIASTLEPKAIEHSANWNAGLRSIVCPVSNKSTT
jgi:hypothetical protein